MNIGVAFSALTMDMITEFTTGRSIACLDAEDFNEGVVTLFAGFGPIWRVAKHVPRMMEVFKMVPSWTMGMLGTKARQYRELQEVSGRYGRCTKRLISEPLMMIVRDLCTRLINFFSLLPSSSRDIAYA